MNFAPERRPIHVGAWNSIVDLWQESWSSFADPARQVVAAATALAPGTSVLDLGCGSGEFWPSRPAAAPTWPGSTTPRR